MIRLIGASLIDWGSYVRLVEQHTNMLPTKIIDESNIASNSPEAFLLTLRSLSGQPKPRHLYYIFACSLDQASFFDLLLSRTDLDITLATSNEDRFFILSGDIYKLVDVITTYTTRSIRRSLRQFLNEMFAILEGLSFKEIFSDYRRIALDDNTFILQKRD